MSYSLFLDDWRGPSQVTGVDYPPDVLWTKCKDVRSFLSYIYEFKQGVLPVHISFDHDLDETLTGVDALLHLLHKCRAAGAKFPICYFHSADHDRRKEMQRLYDIAVLRNPELKP